MALGARTVAKKKKEKKNGGSSPDKNKTRHWAPECGTRRLRHLRALPPASARCSASGPAAAGRTVAAAAHRSFGRRSCSLAPLAQQSPRSSGGEPRTMKSRCMPFISANRSSAVISRLGPGIGGHAERPASRPDLGDIPASSCAGAAPEHGKPVRPAGDNPPGAPQVRDRDQPGMPVSSAIHRAAPGFSRARPQAPRGGCSRVNGSRRIQTPGRRKHRPQRPRSDRRPNQAPARKGVVRPTRGRVA
jgi:hypothetical protein